jgi:hypothetical protein
MANSIAPDLYQEMVEAEAVVEQQIFGLEDLAQPTPSQDLLAEEQKALAQRSNRLNLIKNLIAALDAADAAYQALLNDGYPTLPTFDLAPPLQEELNHQLAEIQAGAGVFGAPPPPASNITVSVGAPAPKVETSQARSK